MKLNKRKCKNCGEVFQKINPLQFVCSPTCAFEYSQTQSNKKKKSDWKFEKARIKEKIQTLGDLKKILQILINKIVRKIDEDFNCISCDNSNDVKYNAGHLHSVGANPTLRFNLLNNFKQCEKCNSHLSGNLLNYLNGIEQIFGNAFKDEIKHEIVAEYKTLHQTKEDVKEAIKKSREELKEVKPARTNAERIEIRRELNKKLNIYK